MDSLPSEPPERVLPIHSMKPAPVAPGAHLWPIPYQPPNRELRQLLQALEQEARPPLVYTGDVAGSLARLRSDLVSHHSNLAHALDRHSALGIPISTPMLLGGFEPGALMEYVQPPNHGLHDAARMIRDSVSTLSAHSSQPFQLTQGLSTRAAANQGRLEWPTTTSRTLAAFQSSLVPNHQALAVRAAALPVIHPQDRGSLFQAEQSSLLYPPIGATFEGYRSRAAAPGQIDSLSDFVHRSKSTQPVQDDLGWLPGAAVRRAAKHDGDQLDIFLKNYMHSGVKPSFEQAAANSRAVSLLKTGTQHELNYHLARFAA